MSGTVCSLPAVGVLTSILFETAFGAILAYMMVGLFTSISTRAAFYTCKFYSFDHLTINHEDGSRAIVVHGSNDDLFVANCDSNLNG